MSQSRESTNENLDHNSGFNNEENQYVMEIDFGTAANLETVGYDFYEYTNKTTDDIFDNSYLNTNVIPEEENVPVSNISNSLNTFLSNLSVPFSTSKKKKSNPSDMNLANTQATTTHDDSSDHMEIDTFSHNTEACSAINEINIHTQLPPLNIEQPALIVSYTQTSQISKKNNAVNSNNSQVNTKNNNSTKKNSSGLDKNHYDDRRRDSNHDSRDNRYSINKSTQHDKNKKYSLSLNSNQNIQSAKNSIVDYFKEVNGNIAFYKNIERFLEDYSLKYRDNDRSISVNALRELFKFSLIQCKTEMETGRHEQSQYLILTKCIALKAVFHYIETESIIDLAMEVYEKSIAIAKNENTKDDTLHKAQELFTLSIRNNVMSSKAIHSYLAILMHKQDDLKSFFNETCSHRSTLPRNVRQEIIKIYFDLCIKEKRKADFDIAYAIASINDAMTSETINAYKDVNFDSTSSVQKISDSNPTLNNQPGTLFHYSSNPDVSSIANARRPLERKKQ